MGVVVEVVIFELRPEVSEDAFMRSAAEASAELKAGGGFVSRLLTRKNDQWIDIVTWETMDDALRAEAAIPDRREVQAFTAAMAPGALVLRHAPAEGQTAH